MKKSCDNCKFCKKQECWLSESKGISKFGWYLPAANICEHWRGKMKKHKWTEKDDKIAFYTYRFCNPEETRHIAENLPMSYASFKMRIANFRHLRDGRGLNHYSKQSKKIFDKYKEASKEEFGFKRDRKKTI